MWRLQTFHVIVILICWTNDHFSFSHFLHPHLPCSFFRHFLRSPDHFSFAYEPIHNDIHLCHLSLLIIHIDHKHQENYHCKIICYLIYSSFMNKPVLKPQKVLSVMLISSWVTKLTKENLLCSVSKYNWKIVSNSPVLFSITLAW